MDFGINESRLVVNSSPFCHLFPSVEHRPVVHIVTTQTWRSAPRQGDQLLKNVLVRFTATIGSAGMTALSLVAEEEVVEELERRVFCRTSMSLAAAEVSKLSGIVSGATVEADQVACSEGRRGRKRWVGWVDIVGWGGVWTWLRWMSGDWALLLIVAHRLIRKAGQSRVLNLNRTGGAVRAYL